jgi:hypothetical protein
MNTLKYALVAAAMGGLALASGSASAMPNGLPEAAKTLSSDVQDVRWVCGPVRCWWRPNWYRSYAFYGHPNWRWRHRGWWR